MSGILFFIFASCHPLSSAMYQCLVCSHSKIFNSIKFLLVIVLPEKHFEEQTSSNIKIHNKSVKSILHFTKSFIQVAKDVCIRSCKPYKFPVFSSPYHSVSLLVLLPDKDTFSFLLFLTSLFLRLSQENIHLQLFLSRRIVIHSGQTNQSVYFLAHGLDEGIIADFDFSK